jgi:hypothetical protein
LNRFNFKAIHFNNNMSRETLMYGRR